MTYFPSLEEVLLNLLKTYWPFLYLFIGLAFSFSHIMEEVGDASLAWLVGWPILLPLKIIFLIINKIRGGDKDE